MTASGDRSKAVRRTYLGGETRASRVPAVAKSLPVVMECPFASLSYLVGVRSSALNAWATKSAKV